MEWIATVDVFFEIRLWLLPIVGALFLVPLMRIATAPFEYGGRWFMVVNRLLGQWEHLMIFPRELVAVPWLGGFAVWQAFLAADLADWQRGSAALVAAALIVLAFAQRSFRREGHRALLGFVRANPSVHPQEFFDHLLCISGGVRHALPLTARRTVEIADADFSEKRGRFSSTGALAAGLWSTIWISRLILMARRLLADEPLREVASGLALVWASRTAQLARAKISVEGRERLQAHGGIDLFCFTHASFLDFAIAPAALAARSGAGESPQRCLPTFLLARDHFRDNPLYYRVLGLGRVAEALGMIFVSRGQGNPVRARAVARETAAIFADGCIDLAIYPQGTRAAPCVGLHGDRIESAYYTVGSRERIAADGKHLKKGAASIAAETALILASRGEARDVRIVPVALSGTGIACPRGRMKVRPGASIVLHVGEPILLTPAAIAEIAPAVAMGEDPLEAERSPEFVDRLHARIDTALKIAGRVHAILERRFFEDIRSMLESLELEEIALAMKPWRGDDFLVHAILDAIYACPPARWRPQLGELAHLMLNFAPRAEMLAFKSKVALSVPS